MPVRHRLSILAFWIAYCGPAVAQLALPGAAVPAGIGTVVQPDARPRRVHSSATPAAAPAPLESNLAGKTVHLGGGRSLMTFTPRDKTVDLSRLLLAGTKISNSGDACEVDVAGMPLPLTPLGKVGGLFRFGNPMPVCPFSFDVLEGSILVASGTATCTFPEADCAVNPVGLWGPLPGDIGPDEVKAIERERTEADRRVRAAYQGLVASTKDRAVVRGFASEQAGFSSHREELCRDYIGESRHGFCAARVTQARAADLGAALAAIPPDKSARKKR